MNQLIQTINSATPVQTGSALLLSSFLLFRCLTTKVKKEKSIEKGLETSRFMTVEKAQKIKSLHQTPIYVYDEESLVNQAQKALQFPNMYGITVRFAMKSCPNAAILKLFYSKGICFDASSGFEVKRAIKAGIKPQHISLSSQELPLDFQELIDLGIEFNACSLRQLEEFGKKNSGSSCGIRFNPGQGSGGTGKTVRTSCHF
jgi:diaminopimelate decarboxylase